jgi:hypothetical protein
MLQHLKLKYCKYLTDLHLLPRVPKIKTFALIHCPQIDDYDVLNDLPKLQYVKITVLPFYSQSLQCIKWDNSPFSVEKRRNKFITVVLRRKEK